MTSDSNRSASVKPTFAAPRLVRDAGEAGTFLVASRPEASAVVAGAAEVFTQIAEALRRRGLRIVQERIFGSLSSRDAVMAARAEAFLARGIAPDGPVTYIQGNPPCGEGLAGVTLHAIAKAGLEEYETIADGGVPCGRIWRKNGVSFIALQNRDGLAGNADITAPATVQVHRLIEQADRLLRQHGASYRDVVRTWFYLRDILAWYPRFNEVRNEKHAEFGLMPSPGDDRLLLPASTAIGAEVTLRAAAVMDLLAVTGLNGAPSGVRQLHNDFQLDAFRYGSAFSRGACIRGPEHTLIHVSGTAAIDEHGRSLHPGNIQRQIATTLGKVEALLAPEKAGLHDFVAATVFVKRPEDAPVFWEMMADRGLPAFPAVCVVGDVCRDELLFEIDGQVVV